MFGGSQLRPNIHIFDMIRAYEFLINAPKSKVSGEIFNAGYENKTVLDLANTVKKIIGKERFNKGAEAAKAVIAVLKNEPKKI